MGALLDEIKAQKEWIVKAFASDEFHLDDTIHSFIEIDRFFNEHSKDGKAIPNGRLSQNLGPVLFSIGAYVGETIISTVPEAYWKLDDEDPQGEVYAEVILPDGFTIHPMLRVINRFKNGIEDSIYVYGHHFTQNYSDVPFDPAYWRLHAHEISQPAKPWWKFW